MSKGKKILISAPKEFEVTMVVSSNKTFLNKEILLNLLRKFIEKNNLVCGVTVEEGED